MPGVGAVTVDELLERHPLPWTVSGGGDVRDPNDVRVFCVVTDFDLFGRDNAQPVCAAMQELVQLREDAAMCPVRCYPELVQAELRTLRDRVAELEMYRQCAEATFTDNKTARHDFEQRMDAVK